MPKTKVLKVPVSLTKRVGDGPCGEMRYQIEIPDEYERRGMELDMHRRGGYFILVGPYDNVEKIKKDLK